MPGTAPPYVSGYEGQVTVDAEALPISNLDFTHMIGSTDATNALGAGAQEVARTIEKLDFTFTCVAKKPTPAPDFDPGLNYPMVFTPSSGWTYTFSGYVESVNPKVNTRGDTTYDVKGTSQGAIVIAKPAGT